ncbi:MAG: hypothetical protein JWQ19_1080 [Subtercola sp.]|nr:hypothetical protein [Subtercola sp.]
MNKKKTPAASWLKSREADPGTTREAYYGMLN